MNSHSSTSLNSEYSLTFTNTLSTESSTNLLNTASTSITTTLSTTTSTSTSTTETVTTSTGIDYSHIYPSCNTGFTIIFLMHNPQYNFTYCQCRGVKMIIADTLVCDRTKLLEINASSICESAINPAIASANFYFTYIDSVGYYRAEGYQLNNPAYCNWVSNKGQARLLMSFLPDGY